MIYNYVPPNEQELETAREASHRLALSPKGAEPLKHFIYDSQREEPIELPAGAVVVLRDALKFMELGHGMTLFPRLAEVTTIEAADILNVSRPYIIKLLEAGEMPYRMVGRHRRIRLEDLMAYMKESDRKSRAAMDELVALSEELGLYDL